MNTDKIENHINIFTAIAVGLLILVPTAYLIWFLAHDATLSLDSGKWGTFGDYFGGILNPVIAFFAFYWLTVSIKIQKKELSETQKALSDSSASQKEQAITQEKKRFEDTFFALLNQHNLILESLSRQDIIGKTRDSSEIEKIYHTILNHGESNSLDSTKHLMKTKQNIHGHYFRVIYQILKFISMNYPSDTKFTTFEDVLKNKPAIEVNEKMYSNILRSFLNSKTTLLLAINCLAADKDDIYYNYRLLLERYEMLEHIDFQSQTAKKLLEQYNIKAFGSNPYLKTL